MASFMLQLLDEAIGTPEVNVNLEALRKLLKIMLDRLNLLDLQDEPPTAVQETQPAGSHPDLQNEGRTEARAWGMGQQPWEPGERLSGERLSGEKLSGERPSGESLSEEKLSGKDLLQGARTGPPVTSAAADMEKTGAEESGISDTGALPSPRGPPLKMPPPSSEATAVSWDPREDMAGMKATQSRMEEEIQTIKEALGQATDLCKDLHKEISEMKATQSHVGEDIQMIQKALGQGNLQDAAGQPLALSDQSAPTKSHTSDTDTLRSCPDNQSTTPGIQTGTPSAQSGTARTEPESQADHPAMERITRDLSELQRQVSSLQGLATDLQDEKQKIRQLEDALGKLHVPSQIGQVEDAHGKLHVPSQIGQLEDALGKHVPSQIGQLEDALGKLHVPSQTGQVEDAHGKLHVPSQTGQVEDAHGKLHVPSQIGQVEDALGKLHVTDGRDQISQLESALQEIKQEQKELREEQKLLREEQKTVNAMLNQLVTESQLQKQLDELRAMIGSTGQQQAQAASPEHCSDTKVLKKLLHNYEKLQKQVNSLVPQRVQRSLPQKSQDEELLKSIQATVVRVEGDCEQLSYVTGSLRDDHRQQQKDIEALFRSLEGLEKKADKEDLLMLKEDKAAMGSKVSCTQFEASMENLEERLQELLKRVLSQEQLLQKIQQQFRDALDTKLDRLELGPFQKQLEETWARMIKQLKDELSIVYDDAAGIKQQLLVPYKCLSCDRDLNMQVPGPHIDTLPFYPPLPTSHGAHPTIVITEEQAQQHSYRKLASGRFHLKSQSCRGQNMSNAQHKDLLWISKKPGVTELLGTGDLIDDHHQEHKPKAAVRAQDKLGPTGLLENRPASDPGH